MILKIKSNQKAKPTDRINNRDMKLLKMAIFECSRNKN